MTGGALSIAIVAAIAIAIILGYIREDATADASGTEQEGIRHLPYLARRA